MRDPEVATFGAGCFWGVQQVFDAVPGVNETKVGYMGGSKQDPTYEEVSTDTTGHAEVVQIVFDPRMVKYRRLLEIFWMNHDPTTLNKQGPDEGAQYRSVVFYHNPAQANMAAEVKAEQEIAGTFDAPIVTQIVPAGKFWEAEEYHQKYFDRRGIQGTCNL